MDVLEHIRSFVRMLVRQVARGIDSVSAGHITPNMITLSGLALHIVIAWLIAQEQLQVAGIMLAVFGLFDALDGELARLQQRVSDFGLVLDATADRLKEGLILAAVAYRAAEQNDSELMLLALAALITAYGISYVKAKAETVVAARQNQSATETNRLFAQGLARFEIRMFVLVVALIANWLVPLLWLLLIANSWTLIARTEGIRRRLA